MSPEKARLVQSLGGKASTARPFRDPELARKAQIKSAQARKRNNALRKAKNEN